MRSSLYKILAGPQVTSHEDTAFRTICNGLQLIIDSMDKMRITGTAILINRGGPLKWLGAGSENWGYLMMNHEEFEGMALALKQKGIRGLEIELPYQLKYLQSTDKGALYDEGGQVKSLDSDDLILQEIARRVPDEAFGEIITFRNHLMTRGRHNIEDFLELMSIILDAVDDPEAYEKHAGGLEKLFSDLYDKHHGDVQRAFTNFYAGVWLPRLLSTLAPSIGEGARAIPDALSTAEKIIADLPKMASLSSFAPLQVLLKNMAQNPHPSIRKYLYVFSERSLESVISAMNTVLPGELDNAPFDWVGLSCVWRTNLPAWGRDGALATAPGPAPDETVIQEFLFTGLLAATLKDPYAQKWPQLLDELDAWVTWAKSNAVTLSPRFQTSLKDWRKRIHREFGNYEKASHFSLEEMMAYAAGRALDGGAYQAALEKDRQQANRCMQLRWLLKMSDSFAQD